MMSLTTKGRYAARILVNLARHDSNGPVTKQVIGKREGISPAYVEQIMMRLKAARLVRSHRGRHGGFTLSRDADAITLLEMLRAVEGPVAISPCRHDSCRREKECPARPVWQKAAEAIEAVFADTTIGEMAKKEPARPRSG